VHVQIPSDDDQVAVNGALDDDRSSEHNKRLRERRISANEILGRRWTDDGVRSGERRDEQLRTGSGPWFANVDRDLRARVEGADGQR
jgi:hypothetical protein